MYRCIHSTKASYCCSMPYAIHYKSHITSTNRSQNYINALTHYKSYITSTNRSHNANRCIHSLRHLIVTKIPSHRCVYHACVCMPESTPTDQRYKHTRHCYQYNEGNSLEGGFPPTVIRGLYGHIGKESILKLLSVSLLLKVMSFL